MKPLSPALDSDILSALTNTTKSCRTIASELGCSAHAVYQRAEQWTPDRQKSSGGRLKKLNNTNQNYAVYQINTGKAQTAVQVAKSLNTILPQPVSTQTVRNALKNQDMKAVVKKKKPLLSPKHKR